MLKLTQQQKLSQKLTPSQVQYLKLLQMTTMALEQQIKTELEQNPLLEEGVELDDEFEELVVSQNQVTEDEERQVPLLDQDATEDDSLPIPIKESDPDHLIDQIAQRSDEEFTWQDFTEEDEPGDVRTWYEDEEEYERPTPSSRSLIDDLEEQLSVRIDDPRLRQLGMELLASLDDSGWLRVSVEDVLRGVESDTGWSYSSDEVEWTLRVLRHLDPAGFGSRSLQECLLAQLEVLPNDRASRTIALRILRESYPAFEKKHFEKIQSDLHITREQLIKALELIRTLNPKPGEGSVDTAANQVTPDFIVWWDKEKEDFIIEMTDDRIPPLRVSRSYDNILNGKRNRAQSEARSWIREKKSIARFFINAILQRRETMEKVMTAIIHEQREFFLHGPGNLKPLIQKDIADIIGMDISTISRVVNGKYVQTEWGTFELKYFFSEGISTTSGEDISNREVKSIIRRLIAEEDPTRPMSDDEITQHLQKMGMHIARRTVAKYREGEGLPVARLRKKLI